MERAPGRWNWRQPLLPFVWLLWTGYYPCCAVAVEATSAIAHGKDISVNTDIQSTAAVVFDVEQASVVLSKNSDVPLPIASITKLMTALIVLEGGQSLDEQIEIMPDDQIIGKGSFSRLRVGTRLTRGELLRLALMSSENRAANVLARRYPGGLRAFIYAMNHWASELGMTNTRFEDPTGLSSKNVATAEDLVKLVLAASRNATIREYSTSQVYDVPIGKRLVEFRNTNRLVSDPNWDIAIQKTGYLNEAGRCVVMQADVEGESIVFVLLNSARNATRIADARRIRTWMEANMAEGFLQISGDYIGNEGTRDINGASAGLGSHEVLLDSSFSKQPPPADTEMGPYAALPVAVDEAVSGPPVSALNTETHMPQTPELEMAALTVASPQQDRSVQSERSHRRLFTRTGKAGRYRSMPLSN